jgi:cyanate lyase
MMRQEATEKILAAKRAKGLSFEQIAATVGRHKVWCASALLGQQSMSAEEAQRVIDLLSLDQEVARVLQECPHKGSLHEAVPVDPLIYRFHEITQIYGTTIKALIHEMFGDGIMSAIDFEMDIEKVPDPKGDRVKITYNGKFLPYRKW